MRWMRKIVHVQKVSAVSVPSKKSKLGAGEEIGDRVRRQGRTGRNFASSRSMMPTVEKLSNIGTAKQLQCARLGFGKTENKAGRPPTRELSGRKAYKRQKHTAAASAQIGFHVGSDDGHEELLAAVTAVSNSGRVFSSAFWREMDTFFGVINADIVFLKQKVSAVSVPSRKSNLGAGEEVGDGVRRQGRTGRNFASSTSMMPTVEKLSNIGTAKQLRSAKLGFEKTENKAGRPPTWKLSLSGRKAYRRQKHTAAASAQIGFYDDGHEELLAAVIIHGRSLPFSLIHCRVISIIASRQFSSHSFLKQGTNISSRYS